MQPRGILVRYFHASTQSSRGLQSATLQPVMLYLERRPTQNRAADLPDSLILASVCGRYGQDAETGTYRMTRYCKNVRYPCCVPESRKIDHYCYQIGKPSASQVRRPFPLNVPAIFNPQGINKLRQPAAQLPVSSLQSACCRLVLAVLAPKAIQDRFRTPRIISARVANGVCAGFCPTVGTGHNRLVAM
jgi:hypothetical protein